MAKRSSTRRTHVSPGIYYKETELSYATKSLGITTLGLAGETLKGPAFQPISIADWREYQTYFGGTSTEKFRGSQYPKYELPYIAKEYLKQSKQLEVVRTLGLSGVNAGPAWVITATKHKCESGYQYTQSVNTDDTPKEYAEGGISSIGLKNDGFYGDGSTKFVTFSVPSPVKESEGRPQATIGVTNAHVNTNCGFINFDEEQYEGFFVSGNIPTGLKLEFAPESDTETVANNVKNYATQQGWGKGFFYADLDNGLISGDIALEFNHTYTGKSAIVAFFDDILNNRSEIRHNDTSSYETYDSNCDSVIKYIAETQIVGEETVEIPHRYIVIPYSKLDATIQTLIGEGYVGSTDIKSNAFAVYQYDYVNLDDNNDAIVSETGKTIEYTSNETAETVCIEQTTADYDNVVIAVLRSRGEHKKLVDSGETDNCGNHIYKYDGIEYYAHSITLNPSTTLSLTDDCSPYYNTVTGDFDITSLNYGKFDIAVDYIKGCSNCGTKTTYTSNYSVSLNPSDKNYITKVLGTDPEVGDAEIYVAELYDIALEQLIYAGEINAINHELAYYPAVNIVPKWAPVTDLLTINTADINNKKYLGKRYLYTNQESLLEYKIKIMQTKDDGLTWTEAMGIPGHIYTVVSRTNTQTGKKEYFYGEFLNADGTIKTEGSKVTEFLTLHNYVSDVVNNNYQLNNCVKVLADDMYYILVDSDTEDSADDFEVIPITLDFNNYKEPYRYASTPWFVSELKGSGSNINLHKLFRFHTISDGDASNTEIKVSIENIDPDMETFDVVIRSFYDSDVNPSVLERYGKCCLIPGESNYIGLKIGTLDGTYASQSAYVTVEINEDDLTAQSIPCGFLGYPVRNYAGTGIYEVLNGKLNGKIKQPYLKYYTTVDEELKAKKQYFGMSDILGIDEDILSYKGVEAYNDDPNGLTPCFHLDARILNGKPTGENNEVVDESGNTQIVSVDGISGYTWVTVDKTNYASGYTVEPRIGTEDVMECTIYEDKNFRKFTACFYGGWDGWDYYRTSRSNSDEFRYNKYKGSISKNSGEGDMFKVLTNPEEFGFDSDTKIITSDYYAYLAAFKQLDNPKTTTIDIFATPGIDYVNQTALVNDVIDIVEEDRGNTLYVVTTPDKPYGAGDSKSEMYTPDEVVYNLEDTEIDTNYACTYYPWEKYYDSDNNQYIYLPVTCDVVRNMAYTDNVKYPWYASAGWNRGDISGTEPKRKLKLAEQDTLYDGRINFINSFAKEGDRIWGDKNLQVHDGIMNRISKRRLLIRLKNLLSTACIGLLFDPNDASMVKTLKSCVASVLDPIKSNRGITDYRVEVDDSDEARDRLELPAKIFIKPTQMLEYIDFELVVTPQGVSWE